MAPGRQCGEEVGHAPRSTSLTFRVERPWASLSLSAPPSPRVKPDGNSACFLPTCAGDGEPAWGSPSARVQPGAARPFLKDPVIRPKSPPEPGASA